MMLIKCPECNHTISDQAESCPNCGMPQNSHGNELALQTELNRIDIQWHNNREKYAIYGKYGERAFPRRGMFFWKYILLTTAVIPGLIVLLSKGISIMHAVILFFMWSIAMLFFLICFHEFYYNGKVEKYEQAEREYLRDRERAITNAKKGDGFDDPIDELETTCWKDR
jgi:hypothetical protein